MRSTSQSNKRCTNQLSAIGEAVPPILNQTCSGVVAARFEHSAYLEFNTEWLCLALQHLGAGPTVLQLDSTVTQLHNAVQVGTPVTFDAHRFILIDDFTVDIDGASPYSGKIVPRTIDRQCVYRWARVLRDNRMTVGFAPLLRQIDFSPLNTKPWHSLNNELNSEQSKTALINSAAFNRQEINVQENELLAYVVPAIHALLDWVHDSVVLQAHAKPPVQVRKLLGAGPGLTPSGDDFLAGVLCAIQLNGNQQALKQLSAALLENVLETTSPVSASLLKQACDGRVNEHAQQLVQCVLLSSNVDAAAFRSSIERMGASSGWDFLTGLILGVLACQV